MESIKIVLLCVIASVVYGIVHDQFTARICLQYFTEFHPPIFNTTSTTLLAFGWGMIATWWAGAVVGLLLVIAARFGTLPQLTARDLFPMVMWLILVMTLSGCFRSDWLLLGTSAT